MPAPPTTTLEPTTSSPTIPPTTETPTASQPTDAPTKKPKPSPTKGPQTTAPPTNDPIDAPTNEPTDGPTIEPTSNPTKMICPDREVSPFCQTVCDIQQTEWEIQLLSNKYDLEQNITTYKYRATTLQTPPTNWCINRQNTETMTIIFLYISTCCTPSNDTFIQRITASEHNSDSDDDDISLFGINGDHWIFYPFKLPRGTSTEFKLYLRGQYYKTEGQYMASHKSWFDGSRPNYRCGIGTTYVPDICHQETKQPTTPTIEPTSEPTTTTLQPTMEPTTTTTLTPNATRFDHLCPSLTWPDIRDCDQFCKNTSNMEWEMVHIGKLYNSVAHTTTIAWTVTVNTDWGYIDDWCFPLKIFGGNYPERLNRVLIRFNKCCSNLIPKHVFVRMIQSVSDYGDFAIVTDEYDMVQAFEWDNIKLQKGKTGMFFITFYGNMTLIDGDYWFFGANKHCRFSSDTVSVPDLCHSIELNNISIGTEVPDEFGDMAWYAQWTLLMEKMGVQPAWSRRRRMVSNDDEDIDALYDVERWIVDNEGSLCHEWIDIVHIEQNVVEFCNVTIVDEQYESNSILKEFQFEINLVLNKEEMNESAIIRLETEYERETDIRESAENEILNNIIKESGTDIDIDLSCQNFAVSEISSKDYKHLKYFHVLTIHINDVEFYMVIFGAIAVLLCLVIFIGHRYYKNKTKMIDGSYPEHEPVLINEIEDLFMEELYENNLRNTQKQNEIHEKYKHFIQNNDDEDVENVDNDLNMDMDVNDNIFSNINNNDINFILNYNGSCNSSNSSNSSDENDENKSNHNNNILQSHPRITPAIEEPMEYLPPIAEEEDGISSSPNDNEVDHGITDTDSNKINVDDEEDDDDDVHSSLSNLSSHDIDDDDGISIDMNAECQL